MNPNIYDYATTEYAQDAFIAWLCASTNHPKRGKIAKAFLSELGVTFPYNKVDVSTQEHNIDVLLTLTDVQGNKQYVIIEDKKFSEEHSRQLVNYVDKLKNDKKIIDNQIGIVYYKTGHLTTVDSEIGYDGKGNGFRRYKCNVESERNRIIKSLKDEKLAFTKIIELGE